MKEARAYLADNGTYNIKYNGALIQGCTITGELVSFKPGYIKYDHVLPQVGETVTSTHLQEVASALPVGTIIKATISVLVLSMHHSDGSVTWYASGVVGMVYLADLKATEYTIVHIPGPEDE